MRFAILFGAVFAAGVLDDILAYGISHMEDIGGLKNWRWLFLFEGLPIIPLGVMTYLFLGSIPDTVQWLNNCEKLLLTNLLREDAGNVALYVSTCVACCGTFSGIPILLSWLTNNVGGRTKRAVAVGFLVGIGQIGGVLAPQVYPDDDDDELVYRRGHFICGGIIAISLIVTFILRICLKLENDRRIHLSPDKYKQEAAITEPCDWVSGKLQ
ncbi:unnamed protein product [Rotaria sordida]|uniref:Uncharacterized protein n=1 Tax=Rotaria sordida TaxID=392033 RepID=A0A816APA6_9BILA|nr:unnamed protein product [Rotaria sordida]CAF1600796.1 unnamed protein product [Rotaria sordida]